MRRRLACALACGAVMMLSALSASADDDASKKAPAHFVLQGLRVLTINTRTLTSKDTPDSTLYEISNGELHVSSSDKSRSLVGPIREAEPNRFLTDHITILVASDRLSATLVQSEESSIKVTKTKVLSHSK